MINAESEELKNETGAVEDSADQVKKQAAERQAFLDRAFTIYEEYLKWCVGPEAKNYRPLSYPEWMHIQYKNARFEMRTGKKRS